jgi:hypothetical protein
MPGSETKISLRLSLIIGPSSTTFAAGALSNRQGLVLGLGFGGGGAAAFLFCYVSPRTSCRVRALTLVFNGLPQSSNLKTRTAQSPISLDLTRPQRILTGG